MHHITRPIALLLVATMLFQPAHIYCEAVDDKSSQISPRHSPGAGEIIHGTGYGKILVRVLMFGAIPQQGIHYVPEGTDLMFAIMYAGGRSEMSKLNGITIRRRGIKGLIQVDLDDLLEEGEPIPKLADGDVVTVPFSWRQDFSTFLTITGFMTAVTSFALTLVALKK